MEIPKEYREAYRKVIWTRSGLERDLQLALRWAVAEALKAEFWQKHHETSEGNCAGCPKSYGVFHISIDELDPRHSWTDENWRQEAERKLAEE